MQRTSPVTTSPSTADYAPPILPNSLRKPAPRKLRKPALRNPLAAQMLAAMAARVLGAARARGVPCAIALALLPLLTLSGCTITAMPAEAVSAFRAVAVSTMDQAVWEEILADARVRVNNPGVRVSVGTEYYVETRLIGTNGELTIGASGGGSGELSDEAREAMISMLERDFGLTPKEAIAAIQQATERAQQPATMTPVTPPSTSPK